MSFELKELSKLYTESNADHKWIQTTSITQVKILGRSMLHYQAELPLNGSNRGYFVRIKDVDGNVVENTYCETSATSSPVTGTIESNYLDFRTQIYMLEFGPHYTAKKVEAVGATAHIIQGRVRNFQSSAVYPYPNKTQSVSFEYNVPSSLFDNETDVKIYLVEGVDIKAEGSAVEGKVFNVKKGAYIGNGEISFDKALKVGGKYTLCMGIFSTVRQIAKYTFIWE